MRTIPKRLQNSYFQLFNSRLISKKHYDNEAIKHFESLLNSSLPTTDYENAIYYFIKEIYYDDRKKFLSFIHNSNLQPFILYTNNKNIINHFELEYKIYINWDKIKKKYKVERYNKHNDSSLSDNMDFNRSNSSNESYFSDSISSNEIFE